MKFLFFIEVSFIPPPRATSMEAKVNLCLDTTHQQPLQQATATAISAATAPAPAPYTRRWAR